MSTLHKARAAAAIEKLHAAYMQRSALFAHVHADTHAPQRLFVPKLMDRGSLDHRQWLFFACMTDRRQVSEGVYKAHASMWSSMEGRSLYSASVLEKTDDAVRLIIGNHRVGLPNQSAGFWKRSASTLFGHFGGDPANMFRLGSIDALMKWKRASLHGDDPLPGYGPKIASLLAIFLEEIGGQAVADALPVDVHVQRFFLAQNLVTLTEESDNVKMERVIRPFLTTLCKERGWNRVDLAHALWLLGNRVCTTCHLKGDAELLCPAYSTCKGAPGTASYFKDGVWKPRFKRMRKGGQQVFGISGPLFDKVRR